MALNQSLDKPELKDNQRQEERDCQSDWNTSSLLLYYSTTTTATTTILLLLLLLLPHLSYRHGLTEAEQVTFPFPGKIAQSIGMASPPNSLSWSIIVYCHMGEVRISPTNVVPTIQTHGSRGRSHRPLLLLFPPPLLSKMPRSPSGL